MLGLASNSREEAVEKIEELRKELEDVRYRMDGLCWMSATYRNLSDYARSLRRDIEKLEAEQEQRP